MQVIIVGDWGLTPWGFLEDDVDTFPSYPTQEVRELGYLYMDSFLTHMSISG